MVLLERVDRAHPEVLSLIVQVWQCRTTQHGRPCLRRCRRLLPRRELRGAGRLRRMRCAVLQLRCVALHACPCVCLTCAHPAAAPAPVAQVLESGQLQDGMGKRCDFRNALLVLATSPTAAPLPEGWADAPQAAAPAPAESGPGSVAAGPAAGPGERGGGAGEASGTIGVSVPEAHVHPEAYASGDSSSSGGGSVHSAHSAAAQCLQPDAGGSRLGAAPQQQQQQQQQQAAVHPLRHLPSELLSRLDCQVSMAPLSPADMLRVVELQLAECQAALGQQGIGLRVEPDARRWLAARGLSPASGARRLQSLLREQLLLPVAEALLGESAGRRAGSMPVTPTAATARVAPDGSRLDIRLEG